MSIDTDWMYWDEEGVEAGPLRLDDVAGLVRSGKISPATDMRPTSEVAWKSAATLLPDLFPDHVAAHRTVNGWTDLRPHPWRRYLARMFDAFVVGTLVWSLIGIIAFSIAPAQANAFFKIFAVPGGQFLDIILTQVVVAPFNALAIGLTGLTLGKWIFGIKVTKDGRPVGVLRALRREASVFLFGLGFGIPFASLFTLIGSYNELKDQRATRWDKAAKLTVNHRPESMLATIGMIVAVVLFLVGRTWLLILARRP
jgi:hypothetical protein